MPSFCLTGASYFDLAVLHFIIIYSGHSQVAYLTDFISVSSALHLLIGHHIVSSPRWPAD
jgi:hypothetical protein